MPRKVLNTPADHNFEILFQNLWAINVLDYGVAGDGTTDDTTALQDFFNGLSGGEVVVFPPGSYKHDDVTLTLTDNVTILAYGATSLGDDTYGVGTGLNFNRCNYITLQGMRFDRRQSQNNASNRHATGWVGCSYCRILDCNFYDVARGSLWSYDVTNGVRSDYNEVSNCVMSARVAVTAANFNGDNGLLPSNVMSISGFSALTNTAITEAEVTANETYDHTVACGAHDIQVGDRITISNCDEPELNSSWIVRSVVADTSVTFRRDGGTVGNTTSAHGETTLWFSMGNKCTNNKVQGGRLFFAGAGVVLSECSNNVDIEGADSSIYLSDAHLITVSGNVITRNGKDPIKAVSSNYGCRDIVISNNVVNGGSYVSAGTQNIGVSESQNVSITGNTVLIDGPDDDNTTNTKGIQIGGGCHNVSVTGNTVTVRNAGNQATRITSYGIYVYTSNSSANDYNISNLLISGNHVSNVFIPCILHMVETGTTMEDVHISGNIFRGNVANEMTTCMRLLDFAGGGMKNIHVTDNQIIDFSSDNGVNMSGALSDVYIRRNHFRSQKTTRQPIGPGTAITGPCYVEDNTSDGIETDFFEGLTTDETGWILRGNTDKNGLPLADDEAYLITTGPHTVDGRRSGGIFRNTGATGSLTFTLPAALPGMEFTFERVATQTMLIDPDGTEYFIDVGSHGYKSLDADGAYLYIKCIKAGTWHVLAASGSVSDE